MGKAISQPAPKNPIINEIELALRGGSAEKQSRVLTSATDLFLFIEGAKNYAEAETKFFDDILAQLIKHVGSRALIEISARLARIANAPINTVSDSGTQRYHRDFRARPQKVSAVERRLDIVNTKHQGPD